MQFLDMNYDLVNQCICHFHPLFNYAFSHPKIAARVEAGHFPLFGPRTYICNSMKRHYTFSCQEKCNCGYEKYHWGWGDTFSCKGPFCMGVNSKWVSSGMPDHSKHFICRHQIKSKTYISTCVKCHFFRKHLLNYSLKSFRNFEKYIVLYISRCFCQILKPIA